MFLKLFPLNKLIKNVLSTLLVMLIYFTRNKNFNYFLINFYVKIHEGSLIKENLLIYGDKLMKETLESMVLLTF